MTGPDWCVLLPQYDGIELQKPASHDDLERVEESLEVLLPADLRALYLVSDGVYDKSGQWFVIWPLTDVIERNRYAWDGWEGTARRQLVGFGDDGTGDPFCVPHGGETGVFIWHPIDQEAYWLADTLEEFWAGWSAGTIST